MLIRVAVSITLIGLWSSAIAAPFGGIAPITPPQDGIMGWIIAQQAEFYREISGAVRELGSNPAALWSLLSLSFAYGVFHAAGPGHGKAIISSYILANEAQLRRGIMLSFASAAVQAGVAVALISLLAIALDTTSRQIRDSADWIELIAYTLVVSLGLYQCYVKGRNFIASLRGNAIICEPDCNHMPRPSSPDWRSTVSAITFIGLRPCSGAIVVLVFALAQGVYWAGIVSTLAMALGTAVTVSAFAAIAVLAKHVAVRLAAKSDNRTIVLVPTLELLAALAILLFGIALLTGYLASETLRF